MGASFEWKWVSGPPNDVARALTEMGDSIARTPDGTYVWSAPVQVGENEIGMFVLIAPERE